MSEEELGLSEMQKEWHGSKRAYFIGFFLSLLLTGISYFLVYQEIMPSNLLVYTITALALSQAIVQIFFFLHIGAESGPRWHALLFLFMILVVLIIIFGSFWIMDDLDIRMMSPDMGGMK